MPGTPATSPRLGAPRISNSDDFDIAGDLNAAIDAIDASARRLSDPITETDMATGATGPAKGSFLAYRNAALTVAAATRIIFDTDSGLGFDTSGWYDTATGKYTPQIAGIYEFYWQVGFPLLADGNFAIPQLWKNDAVYAYGTSSGQSGVSANLVLGGGMMAKANGTTDFFDVRQQVAGGPSVALVVGSAPIRTFFSGRLIGRT